MIGLILAVLALVSGLMALLPPLSRHIQYASNDLVPNLVPDLQALVDMIVKGLLGQGDFSYAMRRLGIGPGWQEKLMANAAQYMSAADYVQLYRRGLLDKEQLTGYITKLKIPASEIDRLLQATEFFPGPADLVRFAVREVYTPAVIEQFGTMEDIPEKYIEEAAKAGLGKEQATNYWASHWGLPSPNQGFEMFQRGIITREQLTLLLKTLDVMPFWREQLIKLSYNVMTRVDVRRMYGLGILTEEQVNRSYQDQGYSPQDAEYLTEFTVKYESKEQEGLTRANVVAAYKNDVISREELKTYLEGFGYVEAVVEFWLAEADYEKTDTLVKELTNDLVAQYLAGGRSIESVRADLDAADLPATYVEQVIAKTLRSKAQKLKVPSREEQTAWLKSGRITEDDYVVSLRLLGYRERDIERYLADVAEGTDTTAQRFLSIDVYTRWYKKKIIDVTRFKEILKAAKYSEADITTLLVELEGQRG